MARRANTLHTNWKPWNGQNLTQAEGTGMKGIYEAREL
jgi:hypothetical protein